MLYTSNFVGPVKFPVDTAQHSAGAATGHTHIGLSPLSTQRDRTQDNAADIIRRLDEGFPILTGPPPAFEASLLELEADIEIVIKRLYAEREKARVGDVVKLTPSLNQTAPDIQPSAPNNIESTQPNFDK